MKKGLVNIAQGTPEQLTNLKSFLLDCQKMNLDRKMKTHADAIGFAIEQAQRVPDLERKIEELEKKLEDCEKLIIEDREMRG